MDITRPLSMIGKWPFEKNISIAMSFQLQGKLFVNVGLGFNYLRRGEFT